MGKSLNIHFINPEESFSEVRKRQGVDKNLNCDIIYIKQ